MLKWELDDVYILATSPHSTMNAVGKTYGFDFGINKHAFMITTTNSRELFIPNMGLLSMFHHICANPKPNLNTLILSIENRKQEQQTKEDPRTSQIEQLCVLLSPLKKHGPVNLQDEAPEVCANPSSVHVAGQAMVMEVHTIFLLED